jgi:3-phenylpropionate/cinnamic acid dioxygenase small subunit
MSAIGNVATDPAMLTLASQLLFREAHYIDSQLWDEWLALFTEDCEFWVPAWKAEHTPTANPKTELSLIYYGERGGLEDRVWRVRSGKSVASTPMPRTHHVISNIMLDEGCSAGRLVVLSNSTVHYYRTKNRITELLYGRYRHELVLQAGHWRIAKKKIVLLNDTLPAILDYYNL